MFISYLDKDLMIARDATGAPDVLFRIPADVELAAKKETDRIIKEDPINKAIEGIHDAKEDVVDSAITVVEAIDSTAREAVVAEQGGGLRGGKEEVVDVAGEYVEEDADVEKAENKKDPEIN
jgi:hypothetical protein